MPKRTVNAPTGTPTWIDYMCHDIPATGDFFHQLLGWDVPAGDPAFGGYTNGSLDGAAVSGFGPAVPGTPVDVQTVYLAADDIELAVDKCRAAGGTVMDMGENQHVMDVADFGRMAVVTDPAGATFGLWQGKQHTGFDVYDEIGAPSWFEVATRDVESTKAFLTDAFGFEFGADDALDGLYELAKLPGEQDRAFGLMEMPAEVPAEIPSFWLAYYTVADLDAAEAKINELGGEVRMRGEIPSGLWLNATTPGGAMFGLYGHGK